MAMGYLDIYTDGIGLGYDMGGVYACVRWISCGCATSLQIAILMASEGRCFLNELHELIWNVVLNSLASLLISSIHINLAEKVFHNPSILVLPKPLPASCCYGFDKKQHPLSPSLLRNQHLLPPLSPASSPSLQPHL